MKNAAFIIIDLQAGIRRIYGRKANLLSFDEIMAQNQALIAFFRAAGAPVLLTSVQPKFFPAKARAAFGRLLLDDGAGLQKIVKSGPSAFATASMDWAGPLKAAGITDLYLSGISLSNGILKTARDGAQQGFSVRVISDASGEMKGRAAYRQTLTEALPHFAAVVSTAAVIGNEGVAL